jgi:hypothetical protein
MIVPYAAGGPTDVFGRIIAEAMKRPQRAWRFVISGPTSPLTSSPQIRAGKGKFDDYGDIGHEAFPPRFQDVPHL